MMNMVPDTGIKGRALVYQTFYDFDQSVSACYKKKPYW